jgi:hypothetical protein
LSICTKEEMRGVIRFLFAEGVKPVEIGRMQAEYGGNYLSRSKFHKWIDYFKKGRTSVGDEQRSGRPSTPRTENNIRAAERISTGKQTNHSGRHYGGFHMFGPMNEALRGRRFSSDEEVIGAVKNWLKMQPKDFFVTELKKNL